MAIARYYKVGVFDTSVPLATGATVTSTTPTPILAGTTTATADCNVSAVRCSAFGANAFPANSSFVASLNIINSATLAGGQTATATNTSGITQAANTTFSTAGGTSAAAITQATLGKFLWSQNIPFTAGANWGEWYTPGFEINFAVSSKFGLYITESSAGTATTFAGEIEFTE